MKTLLDLFKKSSLNYEQSFYTKDRFKFFRSENFSQLYRKAQVLAIYLIKNGLKVGDRVCIFSDNRVEWIISDMAVILAGGVTVPRGSDSTALEMSFIVEHSQSKFILLEHLRVYKKISSFLKDHNYKTFILDKNFPEDLATNNNLIFITKIYQETILKEEDLDLLLEIEKKISSSDLFTIIYTSGTTGNPKGVMLSHSNMIYQLEVVPDALDINKNDRILSILPVWHIFERFMLYSTIHFGASYYYSNIKDLMEDLIRVKPTLMASAPRLWEQIYHKLHERIEKTEALNRELFDISYKIKQKLHRAKNRFFSNTTDIQTKNVIDDFFDKIDSLVKIGKYTLPDMYMDPIFLNRVRAMVGGELKGTLSGGGALPLYIDEFFNAIGIPVYEGYGMTECSPLISLRTKGKIIEGTVGFTPKGTEIKLLKENGKNAEIGETGVIFVKGPGVMRGYYNNPEATDLVLKDGWLNTGDIGVLSLNNVLSIKGRAKDTIVLLSGENVEPVPIEMILTTHKLIDQAVVVGQDKKHLGVLIWPNFETLVDAGFDVDEFDKNLDLNKNKEIKNLFSNLIHNLISQENGFKQFERITEIRFLPEKLKIGDTLTNLQKIKRNVVFNKYDSLIQSMYGDHN
jgi:long-chain acyl-CoA synthetase